MKLSKIDTAKIITIIENIFINLSEKNQKYIIHIPGIKSEQFCSIKPVYLSLSEFYKNTDRPEFPFIKHSFKFSYLGLGNHPSNLDDVTIFLRMEGNDLYLSNREIYGSFDKKVKVNKETKSYLKSLFSNFV